MTGDVENVGTREGYDRWAEIYDGDDNPLVALEEPVVRGLLGEVRGLTVLDLGCGTGRHAHWLSLAGARVTAIDFSPGMLEHARRKNPSVDFRVHDLHEPLPFPDATFDRVVCGLVVDHIADLSTLFREIKRVCKPNGLAVVSTVHPAMNLRGVSARFHEPATGREVRPASCAHQLSDYVIAAVRAGCTIGHLGEHAVDAVLAERHERARKYLDWPLLFVMRLG